MAIWIVGWYYSLDKEASTLVPEAVMSGMASSLKKLCRKDPRAFSTFGSLGPRMLFHKTRHMTALRNVDETGWTATHHKY